MGVGVGGGGQLMSLNPLKLQFRLENFTSAPLGALDPWAPKNPAGPLGPHGLQLRKYISDQKSRNLIQKYSIISTKTTPQITRKKYNKNLKAKHNLEKNEIYTNMMKKPRKDTYFFNVLKT